MLVLSESQLPEVKMTLKSFENLLVLVTLRYNVYPKRVKIIIFPRIEDNKNVFRGVIINKIIKNIANAEHIQTFCVDLAYSIIVSVDIKI